VLTAKVNTPDGRRAFEGMQLHLQERLDLSRLTLSAEKPSVLCTPHFGVVNDGIAWLKANDKALLEWKATIERLLPD